MEVLYSDEDIVISSEWSDKLNGFIVHTKVKNWSLSKYKKYLLLVGKELNKLREKGIVEIFAIPPTEKEEKWENLFGFKDSGFRLGKYKIMRLYYGT